MAFTENKKNCIIVMIYEKAAKLLMSLDGYKILS